MYSRLLTALLSVSQSSTSPIVLPLVDTDHVLRTTTDHYNTYILLCWLTSQYRMVREQMCTSTCKLLRKSTFTDSKSGCGRQCETPASSFIGGWSYICGGKMLSRTSRTTLMSGLLQTTGEAFPTARIALVTLHKVPPHYCIWTYRQLPAPQQTHLISSQAER